MHKDIGGPVTIQAQIIKQKAAEFEFLERCALLSDF
jgi:hypothetical protein